MISAEDIQLMVESGEGYNAEFKISIPSKSRELTGEVCAFANSAGGVLLIGVDDNNKIQGINIDNAKMSAIQNSFREITPNLDCELSLVVVDGKTIGVIEVPSGPYKPYVIAGNIYVRVGPNSQKITSAEQMRDFFQQSDKIYFDEGPCSGFEPLKEIDLELFQEFKSAAHLNTIVPDNQIYTNLKLYTIENHFKNGAVLFFGKYPEYYFEKAVVRCVAFKGIDKRFIMDDKVFGGPLSVQFNKTLHWLKEKLNVGYDIEGQGAGPRKEIWEIPETVFKEAIINALSHRDYYEKGATTTVELFEDRVEISNPGGLVSAISKADFGKRSFSRNPLIFGLFARMQLVEQIGSGVIRMKELMKLANLPEPIFSTDGMFSATFQRPLKNQDLTVEKTVEKTVVKTVEKSTEETVSETIIVLIKANPKVTTKDMVNVTGLTRRGVEYHLSKLKESGRIKRIGSDRGGYWKILN